MNIGHGPQSADILDELKVSHRPVELLIPGPATASLLAQRTHPWCFGEIEVTDRYALRDVRMNIRGMIAVAIRWIRLGITDIEFPSGNR